MAYSYYPILLRSTTITTTTATTTTTTTTIHYICPLLQLLLLTTAVYYYYPLLLLQLLRLTTILSSSLSIEEFSSTFLKNQPGFGANIKPIPYSKVYQDATFEPVRVRIAPILMKLLLMWLVVVCSFSIQKVTSTLLKNHPGLGANLTSVVYSRVYQDAAFGPIFITIPSILMKFLLLWLVVGCCWSVEIGARIFLKKKPGFKANITSLTYSKVYQDATFEPVRVRIAPILMKFLLLWLVVGCCWSVEIVARIFLKKQVGFGANITSLT